MDGKTVLITVADPENQRTIWQRLEQITGVSSLEPTTGSSTLEPTQLVKE